MKYNSFILNHEKSCCLQYFYLFKGILAMANAFNDSGYVTGIIGTIIIGVLCTYCIHQLIGAEYELCKRKKVASLNYVGVTEAALLEGPKCLRKFSKTSVYVHMIIILFMRLFFSSLFNL